MYAVTATLTISSSKNGTKDLILIWIQLDCALSLENVSVLITTEETNHCPAQHETIPVEFTSQECNTTLEKQFDSWCEKTVYNYVAIWGSTDKKCNISDVVMYTTPTVLNSGKSKLS